MVTDRPPAAPLWARARRWLAGATDRETDASLAQLNRLLQTVSEIDAMIVRENSRERVLAEACRILAEVGQYRGSWIGVVDWSKKEIYPIAHGGALGDDFEKLRLRCDESPEGNGPAGRAARTGLAQTVVDTETDPSFAQWRELARRAGYRSAVALPVHSSKDQVGMIVAIQAAAPEAFGAQETVLLERMAVNIGHALRVIDEEQQRTRAERDLRHTNALLENVFANTRVLLVQLDPEFNIVRVNRAFLDTEGRAPEFYAGRNYFDLYPNLERLQQFKTVIETGEPYLAYAMPHDGGRAADGGMSYWDWSVSAIREDDAITGLMLRMIDVTERYEAEARMRKLWGALEQTADSIFITTRDGVIEYANAAFETMTGYRRVDVIGKTPRFLKSGQHDEVFYRNLWDTIGSGEVFREVIINRRKDGSLYYEEQMISPLKAPDGRLTHFIVTGRDITERMQSQRHLQFLAYHDVLTGLPNRALLSDRIEHALARAARNGERTALLFFDIDRFKLVNDTFGHEVGDRLLQEIARHLRACVRDSDTVARLSGDEFALLIEDLGVEGGVGSIARKVLEAFAEPLSVGGQELFVTTSVGISLYPEDGADAKTLLKNADTAMYRAKEAGRNTYRYYSTDMSDRATKRFTLETHLRRALEYREFLIHYQPVLDLKTGRTVGAEALLRWNHHDLGLVPPAEFIPVLEETGLIVPVGEWVIEQACREASQWRALGAGPLVLSLNLSARQFALRGLAERLETLIQGCGGDARQIEFEITESLLMSDSAETRATLNSIVELGCRFAIDDFGTGYSSLGYLKRMPIHSLKIDRSFVRDIPGDEDDAVLVRTIIGMAHNLKLNVIAEGVEMQAQLDFLRDAGCLQVQGYLFARPLPANEFNAWLRRQAVPQISRGG